MVMESDGLLEGPATREHVGDLRVHVGIDRVGHQQIGHHLQAADGVAAGRAEVGHREGGGFFVGRVEFGRGGQQVDETLLVARLAREQGGVEG